MRRTILAVLALVLSTAIAAPAVSSSAAASSGSGDILVQTCYHDIGSTLNTPLYAFCRGLQALTSSVAAFCRMPQRRTANKDHCGFIDGRNVSKRALRSYHTSWVHRALSLQRRLDASSSLYEETFPATHNSFNASSYFVPKLGKPIDYYPTLTNQDPNQVYSITEQLDMDIRGLEVDLHWVPSIYGNAHTHGQWVDVCHGSSEQIGGKTVHVGCTIDRKFENTLNEIRTWLKKPVHHHAFILLYLENQLDGNTFAHNIAASLIRQKLGKLVYHPARDLPPGECHQMPYDESRTDMARHGARILLVGNCGPGNWNKWVFTRGDKWNEGGNATSYGPKDCAADAAAHESHSAFRRWYEESPFLEAAMGATQTFTAKATRRMVRCGVNLTGWDQLTPDDGRLKAFIWSWAPHMPSVGAHQKCAFQGKHGRFRTALCHEEFRFACVDANLDWHVTQAVGRADSGRAACEEEFPGSSYGVPPNGYRNHQLQLAKPKGHPRVWLNYAKVPGHRWRPDPARRWLR
jgi:hypothetical protein